MKQYLGVKVIKAKPMTKADAQLLTGYENKTCDRAPDCEGYLVEYEGGYQSWSPKDVFDEAYQVTHEDGYEFEIDREREYAEHQERVVVEFDNLFKMSQGLAKMVGSPFFETIDTKEQLRLSKQLKVMVLYRDILYDRIINF